MSEPMPGGAQVPPEVAAVIDAITASMDMPDAISEAAMLIEALRQSGFDLVDTRGQVNDTDLDSALRAWLYYCTPPSGAFGQSMTATMAYEANRKLRAVAARHLRASDEPERSL